MTRTHKMAFDEKNLGVIGCLYVDRLLLQVVQISEEWALQGFPVGTCQNNNATQSPFVSYTAWWPEFFLVAFSQVFEQLVFCQYTVNAKSSTSNTFLEEY